MTGTEPAPALEHRRLDAGVFRSILPQGTIVLSERMDSVRSVAVGFWIRQGRVHEAPEEAGASHLLEHMVFKGTERRTPRDLVWAIEGLGGTLDAYTTHEATAYQARVPESRLDVALDVLCDLAFHPVLRDRDLDLERQVVLEEIASLEESPEDVAFERHAGLLYAGHPYGEPVIGTAESVGALSRERLAALHERTYRASNLIVAAAGSVDHERLVAELSRRLPASGPATGSLPSVPTPDGSPGFERLERPGGRQTHIVSGALTVPYRDPLRYAIVVAATALGGGMASRLFQRIREERGLAYSVYSFHGFYRAGGHVGAYVGTRPESGPEARNVLLDEFRRLAERGLGEDELEDTRRQLKGQILISLESPPARMSRLAGIALFEHEYRTLDEVAARIEAVDREICAEAAALFAPERGATLELVPA
ncbi:MAG: pitrilysin family protein [Gemmatimonadota bacterium]|nr:pitrilysin family protein [Gemmatimonadota bacterium]